MVVGHGQHHHRCSTFGQQWWHSGVFGERLTRRHNGNNRSPSAQACLSQSTKGFYQKLPFHKSHLRSQWPFNTLYVDCSATEARLPLPSAKAVMRNNGAPLFQVFSSIGSNMVSLSRST